MKHSPAANIGIGVNLLPSELGTVHIVAEFCDMNTAFILKPHLEGVDRKFSNGKHAETKFYLGNLWGKAFMRELSDV